MIDNIIIVDFPKANGTNNINTNGVVNSAKAAKLNNKTKRPVLVDNYDRELAKIKQLTNSTTASYKSAVDISKEKTDLPVANNNFLEVMFPQNSTLDGTKKLKVTELVVNKTKERYKLFNQNNFRAEASLPQAEPIKEMNLPKEEFAMPNFNPVPETRVDRLYRTGEIPKVNGVINTPKRFGGEDSNNLQEAAHALVNDEPLNEEIAGAHQKYEIGKESERLNRINQVSHGDINYNSDIISETKRLEDETIAVMRKNAELENQITNMNDILVATRKRIADKERNLERKKYQDAENRFKEANDNYNSMTNTFKDLAEKIRELQRHEAQLDQMSNEEEYGGMKRAA